MELAGKECSGCSVCSAVCPHNCIEMVSNDEGFLYPVIGKGCIECGLCSRVCPILNQVRCVAENDSFVIRSRNVDVVDKSASGGFITPLAEYVLNNGGYVCGAAFVDQFKIEHILTQDRMDLARIRGSKYVQSKIEKDLLRKIKQALHDRKTVLFCGTPCQVTGLKQFLNSEYDNLITVDVVCKGVASPKLWEDYLVLQENNYKSKITHVNFRKKNRGYHSSDMEIVFDNGDVYARSGTDLFMRSYVNNICMRLSCYNCHFKGLDRRSDFTIFDAWNAEIVSNLEYDDDKGYTNVFVHSEKGMQLMELLSSEYDFFASDMLKSVQYDGVMIANNTPRHEKRDDFYSVLKNKGIETAVHTFLPIKYKDRLKELLKELLSKIGVLNRIKKIRNLKEKNDGRCKYNNTSI